MTRFRLQPRARRGRSAISQSAPAVYGWCGWHAVTGNGGPVVMPARGARSCVAQPRQTRLLDVLRKPGRVPGRPPGALENFRPGGKVALTRPHFATPKAHGWPTGQEVTHG